MCVCVAVNMWSGMCCGGQHVVRDVLWWAMICRLVFAVLLSESKCDLNLAFSTRRDNYLLDQVHAC